MTYVADTYVLIWYLSNDPILLNEAPNIFNLLEDTSKGLKTVYISTITLVELIYLTEKGKIDQALLDKLLDHLTDPGANFILSDLTGEIALSLENVKHNQGQKLDMPDRIIAADAFFRKVTLLTKDNKLHNSNVTVMWR